MVATLFGDACTTGCITIFFAVGSKPFLLWDIKIKNGQLERFLDPDIKTTVVDLLGVNVSTAYMIAPKVKKGQKLELGITMPFLVMIVKNLHKYFTFEVTVKDDTNFNRRFRVANFASCTVVGVASTVMPIGLTDGWNQIQFNLSEFTRKAYGTQFMYVVSLKVNANIRLRTIYFTNRLVPEEELPNQFRLFYPTLRKPIKRERHIKDDKLPPDQAELNQEAKQEGKTSPGGDETTVLPQKSSSKTKRPSNVSDPGDRSRRVSENARTPSETSRKGSLKSPLGSKRGSLVSKPPSQLSLQNIFPGSSASKGGPQKSSSKASIRSIKKSKEVMDESSVKKKSIDSVEGQSESSVKKKSIGSEEEQNEFSVKKESIGSEEGQHIEKPSQYTQTGDETNISITGEEDSNKRSLYEDI